MKKQNIMESLEIHRKNIETKMLSSGKKKSVEVKRIDDKQETLLKELRRMRMQIREAKNLEITR